MSDSNTAVHMKPFISAASAQLLAEQLAAAVAAKLEAAIAESGRASLVVSGGSTPLPFFKALSVCDIDWSQVIITLADERWVDGSNSDSNERFVRENLLINKAAMAKLIGLYEDGLDISSATAICEQRISDILAASPHRTFDVVVLGMGGDGHTASLFPYTDGLESALNVQNPALCQAMFPGSVSQPRMTLTLAALLAAQHIYLHITGDEKQRVLEQALQQGDVLAKPVCAVFLHSEPLVYWAA